MSWDQLASIYEQARLDHEEYLRQPPTKCPNDGTILVEHDGVLICPFDGWIWWGTPETKDSTL